MQGDFCRKAFSLLCMCLTWVCVFLHFLVFLEPCFSFAGAGMCCFAWTFQQTIPPSTTPHIFLLSSCVLHLHLDIYILICRFLYCLQMFDNTHIPKHSVIKTECGHDFIMTNMIYGCNKDLARSLGDNLIIQEKILMVLHWLNSVCWGSFENMILVVVDGRDMCT